MSFSRPKRPKPAPPVEIRGEDVAKAREQEKARLRTAVMRGQNIFTQQPQLGTTQPQVKRRKLG